MSQNNQAEYMQEQYPDMKGSPVQHLIDACKDFPKLTEQMKKPCAILEEYVST